MTRDGEAFHRVKTPQGGLIPRPLQRLVAKLLAGAMITTRLETDTVIEFIRRLEHGFVA